MQVREFLLIVAAVITPSFEVSKILWDNSSSIRLTQLRESDPKMIR